MKIKLLRLVEDEYNELTTTSYPFDNPWELNIDFPGIDLVLAIDPGTNLMGVTIGHSKSRNPIMTIAFEREKNTVKESTAEVFITNFTRFLDRFCRRNNVDTLMVEGQFLNPKYKRSYALLKTMTNNIKSVATTNNVQYITVQPASWKKVFLDPYPERASLNMSHSNKEHIAKMASAYFPSIALLGQDSADSLGIMAYYYTTIHLEEGEVAEIRQDMDREHTHDLFMLIMKASVDEDRPLNIYKATVRQQGNEDRELVQFKITEDLSLEDNLRSLTSHSNDVFCAYFQPYMTAMQELYQNRNIVKDIKKDTPLFVIGYRKIKK